MRFLVTRPEPGAGETAARLAARGHAALVQPLTRIEAGLEPVPAPDPPGAIVFTSRNALEVVSGWRAAEAWREVPVFTVGEATGGAARAAGFRQVVSGDGDGARLAGIIAAALSPAAGSILYPAARDRAGALEAALSAGGFSVRTVEAYRAIAAERFDRAVATAFRAGTIDGVLFHSRRSAELFAGLAIGEGLGDVLGRTMFLALSLRIAEALRGLGAAGTRVAVRPDEAALLDLLPPAGRGWPETDNPV